MLSLCLTVINTPLYYELTKRRPDLHVPGKCVLITLNQGNERAVQTLLYKPQIDLLAGSFHCNRTWVSLSAPDFLLVTEGYL